MNAARAANRSHTTSEGLASATSLNSSSAVGAVVAVTLGLTRAIPVGVERDSEAEKASLSAGGILKAISS